MTQKTPSAPSISPLDLVNFGMEVHELAPLPMAALDGPRHLVLAVNAAFCRLMERPKEAFIGKSFYALMREHGVQLDLLDRVFRTGQPESHTEEQRFERPSAFWTYTMWPVIVQAMPLGVMVQVNVIAKHEQWTVAMNEALVLGSVHQHELTSISDKLNVQLREEIAVREKLQEALTEKARLLDLSNDAIVVLDRAHRILFWNQGAVDLYGWPREDALGKVSHELLQTQFTQPIEQITEELHRNNHWTGELIHTKRDGKRISVLVRKVLDHGAQGSPVAILETMTDITERMKAVEALRVAQIQLQDHAGQLEDLVAERTAELTVTNQQLEAFTYSIAHDLRAPLRAMQGFSTFVIEDATTVLSASGRDFIDRIDQSAQFMDAMLSDLLAFSRISQQQVELKRVKLESVIGSVLARVQKEIEDTNAFVECSGPWPEVQAHEGTLIQILLNLMGNALKFVRPGVAPRLRLRAEENGAFVRVWVEDNGVGIAPDYWEQVFRLFIRLDRGKYPGTGAGLALVRKGMERMAGRAGVESTLGKGSSFWIELMKCDPPPAAHE